MYIYVHICTLKNMSSSVGIDIPLFWKIKFMFQTNNRL